MGWFSGQFIDIIEWTDDGQDTMVYRFERHNNEIKNGAKLVVRPGQVAVLVNEGQIQPGSGGGSESGVADVFHPGTHDLTTANMPVLSTLLGWKHGFESPFKAEVYFVKTSKFTDLKWGTRGPVTVECDGYGMFELRTNGSYVIEIEDAPTFIKTIVGTDGKFDVDDISNDLREEIIMQVSDRLGELELNPGKLTGQMKDISEELSAPLQEYFQTLGFKLSKFRVVSLTMPEDVRKELMELSRLGATKLAGANPAAMQNLTALRASRAMGDMANNSSGTGVAGAGMEMAMGAMMANQMGGALGAAGSSQPQSAPPLPGVTTQTQYTVAIGKEKHGPYGVDALQTMATDGSFKPELLVWAKGMSGWTKAGEVPELSELFGPPPIPGDSGDDGGPPPLP